LFGDENRRGNIFACFLGVIHLHIFSKILCIFKTLTNFVSFKGINKTTKNYLRLALWRGDKWEIKLASSTKSPEGVLVNAENTFFSNFVTKLFD